MYFKLDIRRLLHNRVIQIMFLSLLFISVLDPVYWKIQTVRFPQAFDINPFNYFGLVNTAGFMGSIFFLFIAIFPVFLNGMMYYDESRSSMREFLIIRGGKKKYLCSKVISVWLLSVLFFAILLALNLLIVYIFFPDSNEISSYYIPQSGTFAATLFEKNPLFMLIFYIVCNVLAVSLFAVFVVAIQMCIRFPNRYIAMIVPVVVLYLVIFLFDSQDAVRQYDINMLIQPASSYAITTIITLRDYLITYLGWAVADVALVIIGIFRNRDVL